MSHFPGTDRYSNPELDWDKRVLEKLAAGNLKSLIGYDEAELDDTGNIELRCWACAAGALGERKPDIVSLDPSWHHNYASLGWIGGGAQDHAAHYPSIKPELVELTAALHALAHDAEQRAQFMANAQGLCRPVQPAARPARGADRARPAGDGEDGRAPAGAVPGAIADPAPAPAAVRAAAADSGLAFGTPHPRSAPSGEEMSHRALKQKNGAPIGAPLVSRTGDVFRPRLRRGPSASCASRASPSRRGR